MNLCRVAFRGSALAARAVKPANTYLTSRSSPRYFHVASPLLKDGKNGRDPKDPKDPKDSKDLRDEAKEGDDLEGAKNASKASSKADSKSAKADKTDKADGKADGKAANKADAKADEADNIADKADAKGDADVKSKSKKSDKTETDSRTSWEPESVESKRRALLGRAADSPRNAKRSNMFNPKEFEENDGDTPPISKNERLLPIQLPFRPVYPGTSNYLVTTDAHLMGVLKRLNETPNWNHRVLAVMSRVPIKMAQLVTNLDDVHEIGCVCLLDNISISRAPQSDKYSAHAAVFPMFRARIGELVENVKVPLERRDTADVSSEGKDASSESEKYSANHHINESERALDQVSVQYMKNVTAVPNEPYAVNNDEIQRLCVRVIDLLHELSTGSSGVKRLIDEFSTLVPQSPGGVFTQPDFLADFTASLLPQNEALQRILSESNVLKRLQLVYELASKEVMYLRVQDGIARYSQNQTDLRNREMILHEYLRYIKKELGIDGDDKSKSADKFLERIAKVEMPDEVKKVFNEELNKFRSLEPTSGEYNTVRSYLDWLSSLPWGKFTNDRFDLKEAARLLDASHYGMQDVKDRILEFLAVGKLNGTIDGKIVCLAGPPGVGKTSIAKSVAEALNRKFERFSVGGMHDASEIKGHRRTYVAAMPGRVVQALKKTQSQNPVILIDEIDKLGHGGAHGSPSAALLEVLDPEQNKNFQDTYLEAPIDLSRVLFLCTANYLDNIPAPLMDRMEIINVPGYLPEEKVEIASSYLMPKTQREAGLASARVDIERDALHYLVRKYTREAGVRGLSKHLEKIFRKIAIGLVSHNETSGGSGGGSSAAADTIDSAQTKAKEASTAEAAATPSSEGAVDSAKEAQRAVEEDAKTSTFDDANTEEPLHEKVGKFALSINTGDLGKYMGPPVHNSDRLYEVLPVGVSMGLGWSPAGGMPLFIESVLQEPLSSKSKPRFTRTGQLGDVMGESTSIAYSFARMFMTRQYPRNRFLDHAVVHTHFPEGALKKDGPSAGITIVTSLVSLAMDVPMHNEVAMTGEITLTGKVLQIGGLREKSVAAKTAGAKTIIFPYDNIAEWEDLPEQVKAGLNPMPVKHFQDVFDIVFGSVDATKINAAWPELQEKEEKERNIQNQVPI